MFNINTILNRYIFKELFPPFITSLLFFSFIFLMAKILDITNLVVNYNTTLITVFSLLFYSMPSFLIFVIPISITMSVLLIFLKMSSENEIVALKSSGVSIYNFIPSVFLFCIFGVVFTYVMITYFQPSGRYAFAKTASAIMAENIELGLKERCFNDNFDKVILYANKIDIKNKTIEDIFIEDKRTAESVTTVIAPEGMILSEPSNMTFYMRLYNGVINQTSIKRKVAHSIHFDTYDISFDVKKKAQAFRIRKNEKDMSITELLSFIENSKKKKNEIGRAHV